MVQNAKCKKKKKKKKKKTRDGVGVWASCLPSWVKEQAVEDLFQNQISPGALSWHESSGTGDLPKLLK